MGFLGFLVITLDNFTLPKTPKARKEANPRITKIRRKILDKTKNSVLGANKEGDVNGKDGSDPNVEQIRLVQLPKKETNRHPRLSHERYGAFRQDFVDATLFSRNKSNYYEHFGWAVGSNDHPLVEPPVSSQSPNRLYKSDQSDIRTDENSGGKCKRKWNIAYIKTYKTGSSTVTNILNRIAWKHNRRVLLYLTGCGPYDTAIVKRTCPLHTINPISKYHKRSKKFSMVMEHVFFNLELFESVMPEDTVYLSSLREPWSQFWSGLHFRGWLNYTLTARKDPFVELFKLTKEEQLLWTKPAMYQYFFEHSQNRTYQQSRESMIDTVMGELLRIGHYFPFMMLTEHFDESLVLLRRYMCWDLEDILYLSMKTDSKYKQSIRQYMRNKQYKSFYAQHNPIDHALYRFYNQTFWKMIQLQHLGFQEELKHFKITNKLVSSFCRELYSRFSRLGGLFIDLKKSFDSLSIPESKWNAAFRVTYKECVLMGLNEDTFRNMFTVKQYPQVCNHADMNILVNKRFDITKLMINKYNAKVKLNRYYCAGLSESDGLSPQIYNNQEAYDWSTNIPKSGQWRQYLTKFEIMHKQNNSLTTIAPSNKKKKYYHKKKRGKSSLRARKTVHYI